jgi:hypothetical protein
MTIGERVARLETAMEAFGTQLEAIDKKTDELVAANNVSRGRRAAYALLGSAVTAILGIAIAAADAVLKR